MIAKAYIDHEGYVIAEDESGQQIGKFPLPKPLIEVPKIHKVTATEIYVELDSGMLITFDKDGKQLDSKLLDYKF